MGLVWKSSDETVPTLTFSVVAQNLDCLGSVSEPDRLGLGSVSGPHGFGLGIELNKFEMLKSSHDDDG